jgi:VanZ family protein
MRLNRANSLLFAGLLYAGGLVVISVSPITEWRFIPEMPWEYLLRGWPKYWTGLDVLLNVLAYIPLGLLIGRAVSHRLSPLAWGPLQAFVFTVCASVLLSILLEAVQTYLPSRRPSVLDVLTNGAGASIGHRENPRLVVTEFGVEFIGKLVAWASTTCFSRVAALEHEAINHAVESDVIVVATLGEVEEIGAGQWCL